MFGDVVLFMRLVAALLLGFGIAFVGILKTQSHYIPMSSWDDEQMTASLVASEKVMARNSLLISADLPDLRRSPRSP